MSSIGRRLAFARWVVGRRLARADGACPYCGAEDATLIGLKMVILEARRCLNCSLIYRYPKADPVTAAAFYQGRYEAFEAGLVTALPTDDQLRALLDSNFSRSRWDETRRVDVLKEVHPPPARVLDFGSSWGYFMAQAQVAGFNATGIELSRSRARFGREKLGLDIESTSLDKFPASVFDIIYSSHVLEHLSELHGIFDHFRRLLAPNGTLLLFVPNCGGRAARTEGVRWGPFINEAHTLSFTMEFFKTNLPKHGFGTSFRGDPDDDELVMVGSLSDWGATLRS